MKAKTCVRSWFIICLVTDSSVSENCLQASQSQSEKSHVPFVLLKRAIKCTDGTEGLCLPFGSRRRLNTYFLLQRLKIKAGQTVKPHKTPLGPRVQKQQKSAHQHTTHLPNHHLTIKMLQMLTEK